MNVIIQIPCLNEQDQLPDMLADLPRQIDGIDKVEWLVIDDGSTDRTVEIAREHGVDHIISFPQNRGLAAAFQHGLQASLRLGADIVVNTDADNQYPGHKIPDLVAEVAAGRADIVIGDRGVSSERSFSWLKQRLQVLGSKVVSLAAGYKINDATTGFRAYSRVAAESIVVVNRYTYTVESLIQSAKKGLTITEIPIDINDKTRDSRLFKSTFSYIRRNGIAIVRAYASYEPLRFFGGIAAFFGFGALLSFLPWLIDVLSGQGTGGNLQSLILGAILSVLAAQSLGLAVVGDLIYGHRVVSERSLEQLRASSSTREIPYLLGDSDTT